VKSAPALVTIGIPCFNSAKWIRQAVESALAQTWPAREVIVVDDGSTDGSREILRSFGEAIRLFCTEHGGAPQARNLAWREARGEWLQYLDADDYLEPGKIAQQFAEAEEGAAADVICAPFRYEVWRAGAVHESYLSGLDVASDPATEWVRWELPQTGGALWRKSALEALGGWKSDQPCCQEHELYLRAIQAGLRFVFTRTAGAVYRLWSEETLCRRDPRLVVQVKTGLMDRLRTWLQERGQWTAEQDRLAGRACFEMARTVANFDLAEAAAYARGRRRTGLFRLEGPAAPLSYRMAYRFLGFNNAERLARALRSDVKETKA
jgi:Glycosyl transferase family 2